MKKIILLFIAIVCMTDNAMGQVPVADKDKKLQWQSMEQGKIDWSPAMYYYLTHRKYSGLKWVWEWNGFKSGLRLRVRDPSATNLITYRTPAVAAEIVNKVESKKQAEALKKQADDELIKAADRNVDIVYPKYKNDFNEMQETISNGLTYCLTQSKGKLKQEVFELTKENNLICNRIDYFHKEGLGYELENSKREKGYIEAKKDMKHIQFLVTKLMYYTKVNY